MLASRAWGVWSILLAVPAVPQAAAQHLDPGARVRGLTVGGRFDGRVAWISSDSLAVVQRRDTAVYAQRDIRALDLATGSRRHLWTGAAIGAGIGAATGVAIIVAADDNRDSELEGLEILAAGTALLSGTVLGGITGALIQSPRWTRVRPSGLGVSISF
jgi:hypothetical protein